LETARKRWHGVTDAVRELATIVQTRHSHIFRKYRPLGAREILFSTKLLFLFSLFSRALSKDFFSLGAPRFQQPKFKSLNCVLYCLFIATPGGRRGWREQIVLQSGLRNMSTSTASIVHATASVPNKAAPDAFDMAALKQHLGAVGGSSSVPCQQTQQNGPLHKIHKKIAEHDIKSDVVSEGRVASAVAGGDDDKGRGGLARAHSVRDPAPSDDEKENRNPVRTFF
jgi:hypothetical protein